MKHKKDTAPTGGQTELFCREDFLVSPTHSQENDSAKRMSATCGRKCVESFKKLNRHGSWAKTFSDLLIGRTDWYSTRCRLIWKLKGTKYKRLYFQLAPQTLRTDVTEFGLLPTATAHQQNTQYKQGGTCLQAKAVKGLLPTPMASDSPEKNTGIRNQDSVAKIAKELAGTTSQLNPRFVLEMMGFPPDWMELPFRSGEMSQSKPQATP